MNLNEYQKWTTSTAIYDDYNYPRYALGEEVGELLGKFAKALRDNWSDQELEIHVRKEAGDIMWQLARTLDDMGISMQEVMEENVRKIEDRKARNKLQGSGDER